MREHEIAHTTRLKVCGPLSRILKHDKGWRALRPRKTGGTRGEERVAKEPSFFTVVDAANELNVRICALVPVIDLGSPNDFTILGTIKGIVWAPFGTHQRSI